MNPNLILLPDRAFLGGVCRVVHNIWTELPSAGVNAVAVFSRRQSETKLVIEEWFAHEPLRVVTVDLGAGSPTAQFWRSLTELPRLKGKVVNLHFNVLESTTLPIVLASRMAGKRVVLTYHHLDVQHSPTWRHKMWIYLSLCLASDVIVSTPLLEERVRRFFPSARTHVIPLGVDPPPNTYDRRALRQKFGLPEDAFVVGHISRLQREKGLPKVVEALCWLKGEYPNIWLVACGTPDRSTQELTDLLAQKLPCSSRMLGYIADHHEMLACCDVLAVPSGWEGFGLVYVEAAMHGIPRIGTRLGGVPYVIKHGADGFLIEPDDIEDLATKIAMLHDNPTLCHDMGERAKERAMAEFTAERMARRYVEALKLV